MAEKSITASIHLTEKLEQYLTEAGYDHTKYTPLVWEVALIQAANLATRRTLLDKLTFIPVPTAGYGPDTLEERQRSPGAGARMVEENLQQFFEAGARAFDQRVQFEAIKNEIVQLIDEFPRFSQAVLRECRLSLGRQLSHPDFSKLYIDLKQLSRVMAFYIQGKIRYSDSEHPDHIPRICRQTLLRYSSQPRLLAEELTRPHLTGIWRAHR